MCLDKQKQCQAFYDLVIDFFWLRERATFCFCKVRGGNTTAVVRPNHVSGTTTAALLEPDHICDLDGDESPGPDGYGTLLEPELAASKMKLERWIGFIYFSRLLMLFYGFLRFSQTVLDL